MRWTRNEDDGSYSHPSHRWRVEPVDAGPVKWRLVLAGSTDTPAYFRTERAAKKFAEAVHSHYRLGPRRPSSSRNPARQRSL